MKIFSSVKQDIISGASASAVALPAAIGLGVLVFAPLGPEYLALGAFSGIMAAIFVSIFSGLFGGTDTQISDPSAPASFILAGVIAELVRQSQQNPNLNLDITMILGFLSLTMLVAAVFQLLFGLLKIGKIITYTPYPVISGFLNGVGLLLILEQWHAFFGVPHHALEKGFWHVITSIQPWTLSIGIVTILALFSAKEWAIRWPKTPSAPLLGILIGSGVYYYVKAVGDHKLGPVIGDISFSTDHLLAFTNFMSTIDNNVLLTLLPFILVSGFTIAIIGSIETLLSSLVADIATNTHHNSNKELTGQGIGNTLSAIFGGIFGAGAAPLTQLNINTGGKTKLAGVVCGLTILILAFVAMPLIEGIPNVVISAVLIYIGIEMIDKESFYLARNLTKGLYKQKEVAIDLFITFLVTVSTVILSLHIAIGLGVILAIALYIEKMGKLPIRKFYTGDQFRSKKRRPAKQSRALTEHGSQIVIFEIQGAIFFGSTENLSHQIEELSDKAQYFILDFKHAVGTDSTGVKAIQRLYTILNKKGKVLLCTYLKEDDAIYRAMKTLGAIDIIGKDRFYLTTDTALEWAEDDLLISMGLEDTLQKVPFAKIGVLENFSDEEVEAISHIFEKRCYIPGAYIFERGDNSSELFLLSEGTVTLSMPITSKAGYLRMAKLCSGSAFGEMAFLSEKKHTTFARADSNVVVYVVAREQFRQFRQEHPQLAVELLLSLASDLSQALQAAATELCRIEES